MQRAVEAHASSEEVYIFYLRQLVYIDNILIASSAYLAHAYPLHGDCAERAEVSECTRRLEPVSRLFEHTKLSG
jgi:hypothetical protein